MSDVYDQALDDIVKSIARFTSESQFGSLEHAVSAYERICAARQKSLEGVALQPPTSPCGTGLRPQIAEASTSA